MPASGIAISVGHPAPLYRTGIAGLPESISGSAPDNERDLFPFLFRRHHPPAIQPLAIVALDVLATLGVTVDGAAGAVDEVAVVKDWASHGSFDFVEVREHQFLGAEAG